MDFPKPATVVGAVAGAGAADAADSPFEAGDPAKDCVAARAPCRARGRMW
jgi:hypothetical protein